jgi:hypothetical protein
MTMSHTTLLNLYSEESLLSSKFICFAVTCIPSVKFLQPLINLMWSVHGSTMIPLSKTAMARKWSNGNLLFLFLAESEK